MLVIVARPCEVDEDGFAGPPGGRMLGIDHSYVASSGALGDPARERGANDQRITMGQERHAKPLAYICVDDGT